MKKGFTLIEVMFALFILLVGITGVIQMYGVGATITKSSGDITYAQNLANTWLNRQLSRNPFLANACVDPMGQGTTVNYNNTTYTVACTITKNQVNSSANVRKIGTSKYPVRFVRVNVTWVDKLNTGSRKNHNILATGLITRI